MRGEVKECVLVIATQPLPPRSAFQTRSRSSALPLAHKRARRGQRHQFTSPFQRERARVRVIISVSRIDCSRSADPSANYFLPPICIPSVFTRNAQRSPISSMIFVVGLPAPCPAFVSMRIKTGLSQPCAACSPAANLKLCAGTTRSS